jgi:hypothetical protein
MEDEVLTLGSILSDRTSLFYNEKIWWEIIPGHNFNAGYQCIHSLVADSRKHVK